MLAGPLLSTELGCSSRFRPHRKGLKTERFGRGRNSKVLVVVSIPSRQNFLGCCWGKSKVHGLMMTRSGIGSPLGCLFVFSPEAEKRSCQPHAALN